MSQSPADRQYRYRFFHPQLNVTLRSSHELQIIRQACALQGITPRAVLLNWARAVLTAAENPP